MLFPSNLGTLVLLSQGGYKKRVGNSFCPLWMHVNMVGGQKVVDIIGGGRPAALSKCGTLLPNIAAYAHQDVHVWSTLWPACGPFQNGQNVQKVQTTFGPSLVLHAPEIFSSIWRGVKFRFYSMCMLRMRRISWGSSNMYSKHEEFS